MTTRMSLPRNRFLLALVGVFLAIALAAGACSSDDTSSGDDSSGDTSSEDTATTETTADGAPESTDGENEAQPVTILVTNDDGVGAEGIDALTQALAERDDVELVVVAPLENQSGSGGKTTAGELSTSDATTASGLEATAVAGFPADSVRWALTEGGIEPDLVISGINDGQNIGPLVDLSGTVGAARQAAQLGVPAVATSQGFGEPPAFEDGVEATLAWLDENLEAIRAGELGTDTIVSINTPTCATGAPQGEVDAPRAEQSDADLNAVDCAGAVEPTDDVVAFTNGWIAVTVLPPTGSITE